MRPILALFISIILFSCSKNNDTTSNTTNPPNPVVYNDTLSAGWSANHIVGLTQAYDIYFADNQTGYFLENSGIFKSTDGGHNWTKISDLVQRNLSVTPDGKIFTVGNNSLLHFSTDAGASFGSIDLGGSEDLTDVYFTDNNNGFAVARTKLFHTTDGGISWNNVQPLSGLNTTGSFFASIFFLNTTTGWIGYGDNCFYTNTINNWQMNLTSFTVSNGDFMSCVYATDANTVFLSSSSGRVYKSVDGGNHFSLLTTFPGSNTNWSDIQFVDSNTGYTCYSTKLYKTVDGGNTWQAVVSMQQKSLIELYFSDANHGWAVGETGVVVIYNP